MSAELIYIARDDFNRSNDQLLFEEGRANNRFAFISDGRYTFRFSWHSDLINPVLTELKQNTYCIGIDQHFTVVDFNANAIAFSLSLFYNFSDTFVFGGKIFICTELEIIVVNADNYSEEGDFPLPDFFEDIIVSSDGVKVKCFGDLLVQIA